MIDLHSHILPGMDDGPGDNEQSLAMARIAVMGGIEQIVCTPHWVALAFENSRETVIRAVGEFQGELDRNGIGLRVYPGAELRLDVELPRKIEAGEVATLNDTGRYALIELPDICLLPKLEGFFGQMIERGVTPVISHPERNMALLRAPGYLRAWVERGVLAQVTAASVSGRFGSEIERFSMYLVEHLLVHVIASDAHDPRFRTPVMADAVEKIGRIVGRETAEKMVGDTPRRILEGKEVRVEAPLPLGQGAGGVSLSQRIFSFLGLAKRA
jgi:protein-tyrosine phosphatase